MTTTEQDIQALEKLRVLKQHDLEALFTAARELPNFKSMDDAQLREHLIHVMYDDARSRADGQSVSLDADPDTGAPPRYRSRFFDRKLRVLMDQRRSSEANMSHWAPPDDDAADPRLSLLRFIKGRGPIAPDPFWDVLAKRDPAIARLVQDLKAEMYRQSTNFLERLIDLLLNRRSERLKSIRITEDIQPETEDVRAPIFGHALYEAAQRNQPWVSWILPVDLPESPGESVVSMIESLHDALAELFLDADLNSPVDENGQRHAGVNELMFVAHTLAHLAKGRDVATLFRFLTDSSPKTPSHPLRSGHLLYPLSWLYVDWYQPLTHLVQKDQSVSSPDGPTGRVNLSQLLSTLDEVPQNGEGSPAHKAEAKARVAQNRDRFISTLEHLGLRLQVSMRALIADILSQRLEDQSVYAQFQWNPAEGFHFVGLSAQPPAIVFEQPFGDLPSSWDANETDADDKDEHAPTRELTPSQQVRQSMASIIKILSTMELSVQLCLGGEGSLKPSGDKQGEARYAYFRDRDFRDNRSQEAPDFKTLKQLQDSFDMLQVRADALQDYKRRLDEPLTSDLLNGFREELGDVSLIAKDLTDVLQILHVDATAMETYAQRLRELFTHVNLFYKKAKEAVS